MMAAINFLTNYLLRMSKTITCVATRNSGKVVFMRPSLVVRNVATRTFCLIPINNFGSSRNKNKWNGQQILMSSFLGGILSTFGFVEEEEEGDPMVMTIKRGILCLKKGEYGKAETIFHAALKMAADLQNRKAEEYIYAMMGENALEQRDWPKAENIYKELLRRLLTINHLSEDDEAVIEISLHLAMVYKEMQDYEKADEAFKFCIIKQKPRIDPIMKRDPTTPLTSEDENSLALYAWILDWFSKYCLIRGDIKLAHKYIQECYDVTIRFLEESDLQRLVVTSDLGVSYQRLGKLDEAIKYLKIAVEVSNDNQEKISAEDSAAFFYNIGMVYLQLNDIENAKFMCIRSMALCDNFMVSAQPTLRRKAYKCLNMAKEAEDKLIVQGMTKRME